MRLEDVFVAKGLVRSDDLQRAANGRPASGLALADRLVALKLITPEQIAFAQITQGIHW